MNDFSHILAKHGVLTTFHIARKVRQSDIRKLRKELKKTCKNSDDVDEKLQQMVLLQMRNTLHFDKIPGLIIDKNSSLNKPNHRVIDPFKSMPIELKQKIVGIVMMVHELLKKENFNKELILIFLQILLMENKITNGDIKSFNEKYKLKSFNDEDDEDDEDNTQPA